MVEGSWLMVEG